jgi:hypothetical protein
LHPAITNNSKVSDNNLVFIILSSNAMLQRRALACTLEAIVRLIYFSDLGK